MTGKDPKDMTTSELLRWAANGEADEYGLSNVHSKLLSALGGRSFADTTTSEDRESILTLANKIDAEIEATLMSDSNDVFMTILDKLITFNGYPSRRKGEGFVGWVERCWFPHPRYEDGEPVQFGDEVKTHNSWQTSLVTSFKFTEDGSYVYYRWAGENDGASVCGEHVKRPAPEVLLADGLPAKVGETVYRVDTGKGFEIARIAPMCPGDDMSKTLVLWGDDNEWRAAIDHTHTPPVLAADGLPLREGDTVWLTDEGARHAGESDTLAEAGPYALYGIGANDRLTVKALPSRFHPNRVDLMEECACCPASWFTHEEPDTQARICADALKSITRYWGCEEHPGCERCPARIDGKTPRDRFDTNSCGQAQLLDLLRRQRELDARKGGE